MASGKIHNRTSIALSIPMGIVIGQAASPEMGIGAGLGCLLGTVLTPDLDQVSLSKSEWAMIKKFGPLGFLWAALWWPYTLIPHRSPLSHWPIIGTAGRIGYCYLLGWLGWALFDYPSLPAIPAWGDILLRGLLIGLLVSDTAHFVFDVVVPRKKRGR